jgi:hypothetical protein
MRAQSGGREALWAKLKEIVARLGIDATEISVTSWRGDTSKLRTELESIGVWADALRRNRNPTSLQIADKLKQALGNIDKARAVLEEVKKEHWPRQRLYEDAQSRLDTAVPALTEATAILRSEHDVLASAPAASKGNANKSDTLFRRHALRIWCDLGGAKLERTDAIDFIVACEALVLGKPNRETIQKWLARNWPLTADTPS